MSRPDPETKPCSATGAACRYHNSVYSDVYLHGIALRRWRLAIVSPHIENDPEGTTPSLHSPGALMVVKMETMRGTYRSFSTPTTQPPVPRFSCEFVHRECSRAAMFDSTYLRTNRTNHTKIMRCFPHCCPDHRQRSYCGSAISVHVQALSPRFKSFGGVIFDEIVVYGRFRPQESRALRIGDRIAIDAIESSLQSKDPSKGEWIQSRASRIRSTTDTWIFEINPSGRWYYSWSGAATIAMRTTEHIFEALAFRYSSSTELEVIASAVSPPFRLMSFRRGSTMATKDIGTNEPVVSDESPRASPQPFVATRPASPTRFGTKRIRDTASVYPQSPAHHQVSSFQPASQSEDTLAKLLNWLQKVPATSVGSRWMLAWERLVLDACAAHVATDQGGVAARSSLVPILSALDVSSNTEPEKPSSVISLFDAIDVTVRMLLNEWLDATCLRASSIALDRCLWRGFSSDRAELGSAFRSWVKDIEMRAKRFLHTNSTATWSHLLAIAEKQEQVAPQGCEFGYRAFVSQCRQRFVVESQTLHNRNKKRRYTNTSSDPSNGSRLPPGLKPTGLVWVCGMEDMAIEVDTVAQQSLSLLTVVQFWKHLSCIRIDYTVAGVQPPQLSLASVFNPTPERAGFMRLVLDGKYRWFSSLPNGDATIGSNLMGYVVGDYVGRVTSTGSIHVTTFLWPATTDFSDDVPVFAWHWTLDSSTVGSNKTLTMSIVIETSRVECRGPLSFETMSVGEKLRCIGRWEHVCQVHLGYNRKQFD